MGTKNLSNMLAYYQSPAAERMAQEIRDMVAERRQALEYKLVAAFFGLLAVIALVGCYLGGAAS